MPLLACSELGKKAQECRDVPRWEVPAELDELPDRKAGGRQFECKTLRGTSDVEDEMALQARVCKPLACRLDGAVVRIGEYGVKPLKSCRWELGSPCLLLLLLC